MACKYIPLFTLHHGFTTLLHIVCSDSSRFMNRENTCLLISISLSSLLKLVHRTFSPNSFSPWLLKRLHIYYWWFASLGLWSLAFFGCVIFSFNAWRIFCSAHFSTRFLTPLYVIYIYSLTNFGLSAFHITITSVFTVVYLETATEMCFSPFFFLFCCGGSTRLQTFIMTHFSWFVSNLAYIYFLLQPEAINHISVFLHFSL